MSQRPIRLSPEASRLIDSFLPPAPAVTPPPTPRQREEVWDRIFRALPEPPPPAEAPPLETPAGTVASSGIDIPGLVRSSIRNVLDVSPTTTSAPDTLRQTFEDVELATRKPSALGDVGGTPLAGPGAIMFDPEVRAAVGRNVISNLREWVALAEQFAGRPAFALGRALTDPGTQMQLLGAIGNAIGERAQDTSFAGLVGDAASSFPLTAPAVAAVRGAREAGERLADPETRKGAIEEIVRDTLRQTIGQTPPGVVARMGVPVVDALTGRPSRERAVRAMLPDLVADALTEDQPASVRAMQEAGPTISNAPDPGFVRRRVEDIEAVGRVAGAGLNLILDVVEDPRPIVEWAFKHPVDAATIVPAIRQLGVSVLRGTITDDAVRAVADEADLPEGHVRDGLGRLRAAYLKAAPREVEDAAAAAERARTEPLRLLPAAPAEAELRSTGAAGPIRDVPVGQPRPTSLFDEGAEVAGGTIPSADRLGDDIIGRARQEAAAAFDEEQAFDEVSSFFDEVGSGADEAIETAAPPRPDPVRRADAEFPKMDLGTSNRLSRGLDGQIGEATPLDRSRGLVDGAGNLTDKGRREIQAQAHRRLVDRGVPEEVADEVLRIMGVVERQADFIESASDVSFEEAVFRAVDKQGRKPLGHEFLERGGVEPRNAPARLARRARKQGAQSIDELEDAFADTGVDLEQITEANVVDVLLGPAPSEVRLQRVADGFVELGLATDRTEAVEMAELFQPANAGKLVRNILRGPGTEKNPNVMYRKLVEFAENRVDIPAMADEAARAVGAAADDVVQRGETPTTRYVLEYARALGAKTSEEVPAFIRVTAPQFDESGDKAARLIDLVEQISGNVAAPIEAAMKRTRPVSWWRQTVKERAAKAGLDDADLRRIAWAHTGREAMPTDVGELKLIAQHIDDTRSGKMPVAADAATLRELRRELGPQRFKQQYRPELKQGEVIPTEAIAPEGAGFVASLQPSAAQLADVRDITWIESILVDADKNIPQLRPILGDRFDAYHRATFQLAKRLEETFQGLRNTSEEVGVVTQILSGQLGDEAAIFSDPSLLRSTTKLTAKQTEFVAGIAREVRAIEDEMLDMLRHGVDRTGRPRTSGFGGPLPDLQRRPHHLAFLREHYWDQNRMPPDLVRFTDRKFWFRFAKRTSDEIPENLNVMDSLRAYIPAALRQVYLNPAFPELDDLRESLKAARQPNRVHLLDDVEAMVKGEKSGAVAMLDNDVRRLHASFLNSPVGRFLGLQNNTPGDAERLSMFISQNFYRGILGLNMSAAVNNATQSLNTIADVGALRTLQGVGAMLTPGGRRAARRVDLDRQFARIFEENYKWGTQTKTLDEVLFAPFQAVEFFNRGVAFHAGASQALARGAGTRQAIKAGVETAGRTQFYYDEVGRSPIFRSGPGRAVGVLTSFPLKQAQFLREMATESRVLVPGSDQQVRMGGLFRYLLAAGLASAITEELMGVRLSALSPTEIPGTGGRQVAGLEFANQLEGGTLFTNSPVVQLGSNLGSFFSLN